MADVRITLTGNLTADPDVRFSPAGKPLARFSVAQNRRKRDVSSGEWVEDEPLFLNVACFGRLAEHVGESVRRGQRVVVEGRLVPNTWTTPEGDRRRTVEVVADDVAVSLLFAAQPTARLQPVAADAAAS